jgi:S-phase kinase-associated protein 1
MAEATADETRTVHLVSQEGESFDVQIGIAKMSELVKTMIDEDQDEEDAQEIPLPNVKSPILAKVIEFCQHYKTEPMNEIEKVNSFYPQYFYRYYNFFLAS